MIKHFLLFAGLLFSMQVIAQTGIGTSTPHASAKLDVNATDKGFLPPRVTLTSVTDATTIPSPATGLLVYNVGSVGLKAGYYYWNSSNWATIATASSPDQTVDYVSVVRTTSQTVNTGDNLIFNSTNGGNIPYNSTTGNFSLTAGKTYRLTGSVSLDGSNGGASTIDIAWKNAAGDVLGNRGLTISANLASTAAGNGLTDIVYTPSINTTVSLNVILATPNAKTVGNYTYANIEQIGSSAFVNPWILSGTTTYNTTGNVGIGTSSPNASAILDITSTTKGITFPRMTSTQRNAISSPTNGLQVFDITTNSIWYYDGTSWVNSVSVASFGDIKTGIQTADHNGWVLLNGRVKTS